MFSVKCSDGNVRIATAISLASVIFEVLQAGLRVVEIVRG